MPRSERLWGQVVWLLRGQPVSAQLGKGTNGKDGDTDGACTDLVSKRETENKQ